MATGAVRRHINSLVGLIEKKYIIYTGEFANYLQLLENLMHFIQTPK